MYHSCIELWIRLGFFSLVTIIFFFFSIPFPPSIIGRLLIRPIRRTHIYGWLIWFFSLFFSTRPPLYPPFVLDGDALITTVAAAACDTRTPRLKKGDCRLPQCYQRDARARTAVVAGSL